MKKPRKTTDEIFIVQKKSSVNRYCNLRIEIKKNVLFISNIEKKKAENGLCQRKIHFRFIRIALNWKQQMNAIKMVLWVAIVTNHSFLFIMFQTCGLVHIFPWNSYFWYTLVSRDVIRFIWSRRAILLEC